LDSIEFYNTYKRVPQPAALTTELPRNNSFFQRTWQKHNKEIYAVQGTNGHVTINPSLTISPMIEIEKKFHFTPEQEAKIIASATFLGEKIQTDTYYDTLDFVLTCKDIWLRNRNGRFEIKTPLHVLGNKMALTQYREIETDEETCEVLHLPPCTLTNEILAQAGYAPFSTITTTRKRYQDEPYSIDLDSCDLGDGHPYLVAEIEIMTEENQKEEAAKKLVDYAVGKGFSIDYIRGKLLEYLYRHSPEHYKALVDAGVIYVPTIE